MLMYDNRVACILRRLARLRFARRCLHGMNPAVRERVLFSVQFEMEVHVANSRRLRNCGLVIAAFGLPYLLVACSTAQPILFGGPAARPPARDIIPLSPNALQ